MPQKQAPTAHHDDAQHDQRQQPVEERERTVSALLSGHDDFPLAGVVSSRHLPAMKRAKQGRMRQVGIAGKHHPAIRCGYATLRKISEALVPPKPNEFDSDVDLLPDRHLGHQVDHRLDRRIIEVEGGRRDVVAHGEQREDRLDRAGGTEQMSDGRLSSSSWPPWGPHRRAAASPRPVRSRRRAASRCRGR